MTLRSSLYTSAVLSVIALTAACAGGAPAVAPSPGADARPIRSGETLAGTLTDADPQLEDGSRFDLYAFDGQAGEEVEITLRSDAFDAYVSLGRHVGGEMRIVQSDDDGADDMNARVSTVLPGSGRYLIRANSFDEDGRGDYHVSFVSQGVLPEPSRRVMRAGESASGSLSEGDAWVPRGSYFDLWDVEGTPGEVVRVDLQSEDFDSYLSLVNEEDGEIDEVRHDDDGGEGLDARLYIAVPPSGRFTVRARSLGSRESGEYRISAVSEGVRRDPEAVAVSVGAEIEAALDPLDAVLENGIHYDEYTFHGEAGETVEVEMLSDEFDTYLVLGTASAGSVTELSTDDDGGSGTNARIRHRLPRTGEYVIRARSYGASESGEYTLTVGHPLPERPASRTPIALDSRERGSLDRADPTIRDGKHYDLWIYEGEAGSTIRVDMRSEDFDTYLAIGTEVDGEFVELESNDDASGTDSRIVLRLPLTGTYVIRASSFGDGVTGGYDVSVTPGALDYDGSFGEEAVIIEECATPRCGGGSPR